MSLEERQMRRMQVPTMLLAALSSLFVVVTLRAQYCRDCPLPATTSSSGAPFYVLLRDRVRIENVQSLVRSFLPDGITQAVRIQYVVGMTCRDTLVPTTSILEAGTVGLGLDNHPRIILILPVRQFERRVRPPDPSASFVEAAIIGGVTGKDTSIRRIGSSQLFPSLEAIVAPFETMLGKRWAFGFLVGAISDGTRWRIPFGGHLRYWFSPQGEIFRSGGYRPDSCTFNERTRIVFGDDYREQLTPYVELDSSAAFVVDYTQRSIGWQPFLFLEGGTLFNTDFPGAGKDPSLNPEDYQQWFLGAGAGITPWKWLVLSIAYRYQRLNVRTPCAVCPPSVDAPDSYIVNTARLHSLLFKIGVHFRF
jgi:hypothetical protein